MAPKKRSASTQNAPALPTPTPTRRSPRFSPAVNNPVDPPPPKAKKAKKSPKTAASSSSSKEDPPAKTVIIEYCKQCSSFKTRAEKVKTGLEEGVAGVNVVLNPEKPRRGCFEIREEDGEVFVSLLDLKRPFQAMKDLVIDDVVADIIQKMN